MSAFPELTPRKFTVEEYLTLERKADFKSEFYYGGIYAMAGAMSPHNLIVSGTLSTLFQRLLGQCFVFGSDQKVKAATEQLLTYPDVTVVCGELKHHDRKRDVIINPRLVVEVLSPSTQRYDRGAKREEYQRTPSITDILLISQDKPQIEHHYRAPNGEWQTNYVSGLNAAVPLASLDIELPLSAVYILIEFTDKGPVPRLPKNP